MPPDLISTLACVSAAAVLAPVVAAVVPRRVLPIIVAEILLGIGAGPSGLGLIGPNAVLSVLSALGFAMLMFVAGMEIDLKVLVANTGTGRAGPRRPLAWSLAIVFTTFALSLAGTYLVFGGSRPFTHVLFLALVLSTTSVGIVVPTLKERGLTAGPYGQILLAGAILADFLTMLLISVLAAAMSGGDAAQTWLPVLFVLFAAGVGICVLRLGRSPPSRRYVARLDTSTGQLPLRAAFALVFVLALVAEHLGAELVLAAFLAGIVVGAVVPRTGKLHTEVEALGFGFLIPMFFFSVGVGFDLPALLESDATLVALPALLLIAYANKILAVLPLARYFSWNQVVSGGVLLSARLSLIIAAAAIGMRLGVLDSALNAAMILLAIFTAVVSPLLFNVLTLAGARERSGRSRAP